MIASKNITRTLEVGVQVTYFLILSVLHLYKRRSNIFLSHRNVARVNVMLYMSHTKAVLNTVLG